MNQKKLKYVQYLLIILGLLGLVDLLTVSITSDIVREAYNLEVENWGIVTAILFEIGLKFGTPAFSVIGLILHDTWIFLLFAGYATGRHRKKLSEGVTESPANTIKPGNNRLVILIAIIIGVGLVISAFIITKSSTESNSIDFVPPKAEQKVQNQKIDTGLPTVEENAMNVDDSIWSTFVRSRIVKVVCPDTGGGERVGTGMIYVHENGWVVLTNAHVISDTPSTNSEACLILEQSSEKYSASVSHVSTDYPYVDFAVLKPISEKTFVKYVMNECKSIEIGDRVVVLGYPDTGDRGLVQTKGVVSDTLLSEGGSVVETTAETRPGNSGGIALNLSKKCSIGIVTWATEDFLRGYVQTWSMLSNFEL